MAHHHHDGDGGSSGVNAMAIVAILAILVGVGLAIWFFVVRSGGTAGVIPNDVDIDVKVDSSSRELVYRDVA
jgi:hypothetical protein